MTAELPLLPEDVAEIVSILDRTPYDRIDIRSNRFSLTVQRSGQGWVQSWTWQDADAPASDAKIEAAQMTPLAVTSVDAEAEGLQMARATLPGTFYRAPSPGAKPFIEVGSSVAPDTVVGIIETMKLMTPVHAGHYGQVIEILIENGTLVDANAALIRIRSAIK